MRWSNVRWMDVLAIVRNVDVILVLVGGFKIKRDFVGWILCRIISWMILGAGASAPLVAEHAYCNCLCDAVYMFVGSALDSLAVTILTQISEERFA